jgi:hypothetical protein
MHLCSGGLVAWGPTSTATIQNQPARRLRFLPRVSLGGRRGLRRREDPSPKVVAALVSGVRTVPGERPAWVCTLQSLFRASSGPDANSGLVRTHSGFTWLTCWWSLVPPRLRLKTLRVETLGAGDWRHRQRTWPLPDKELRASVELRTALFRGKRSRSVGSVAASQPRTPVIEPIFDKREVTLQRATKLHPFLFSKLLIFFPFSVPRKGRKVCYWGSSNYCCHQTTPTLSRRDPLSSHCKLSTRPCSSSPPCSSFQKKKTVLQLFVGDVSV